LFCRQKIIASKVPRLTGNAFQERRIARVLARLKLSQHEFLARIDKVHRVGGSSVDRATAAIRIEKSLAIKARISV
jgi:hypothetical protein